MLSVSAHPAAVGAAGLLVRMALGGREGRLALRAAALHSM